MKLKYNIFAVIFAFLVLLAFYHVAFARRIIPGVVIGSTRVGGLTYEQALERLRQKESSTNKVITLRYADKVFTIEPQDYGLEYRWDEAVTRAVLIGRSGNFLVDTKDKVSGIFRPLYIKSTYTYTDSKLSREMSSIKAEINREGQDASFVLKNGQLDVRTADEGVKVLDQELYESVISSINNLDFSEKPIKVKSVEPSLNAEDVRKFSSQVQQIIDTSFKVVYEKSEWPLNPEQKLDLIKVQIDEDGGTPDLVLNTMRFEDYIEEYGLVVNQVPRGKVTGTEGTQVTGFEITKNGTEIDKEKFAKDFSEALFGLKPSVTISTKEVNSVEDKSKYGIFALLGEGSSKFSGSITGRVKNIVLSAQRTDGVLVAPGATYSFNRSVGEISTKTGYDTAYIIQNGRTVLGEGGGVCQTSTTLFRAVLNAGLPITTRFPHAYRVGYYEQDGPPGLDASVFQPSVDFQFKNDTSSYILVQAYPDPKNYTLNFKIYGTPDGRKVEITKPVVTAVVPAPEPLYQDDPTLEKGKVKQVDWAANGANVSFNRTVQRGDEVLYEDTFTSKYQPWRAVYLKGTKE
jgi:vancomycin resistance protein YoaR